jgi:hypothetical protein
MIQLLLSLLIVMSGMHFFERVKKILKNAQASIEAKNDAKKAAKRAKAATLERVLPHLDGLKARVSAFYFEFIESPYKFTEKRMIKNIPLHADMESLRSIQTEMLNKIENQERTIRNQAQIIDGLFLQLKDIKRLLEQVASRQCE